MAVSPSASIAALGAEAARQHHDFGAGSLIVCDRLAPLAALSEARADALIIDVAKIPRGEFTPQPGDVVAQEHWCSSGFANTDLDLHLKKHAVHRLIVIGLIAHTCVEATVRYAAELGYEVTVVKDATADYSDEHMHAALDINIPNYASAVVSTEEVVASISSLQDSELSAQG